MKDFKPICVDDIFDTLTYGKVQVQDLFVSPRTGKIVYQVEIQDDSHMVCIATEDELKITYNIM